MSDDSPTPSKTAVISKISPRSVTSTVSRLTQMLDVRGIRLFAVIDQSAEARHAGLQLRETTLVIFGSPVQGTPVMVASPLAAVDLPLRVVIWADGKQTKVSYTAPSALAFRYDLAPDLAKNLAGIDALTDALVAP